MDPRQHEMLTAEVAAIHAQLDDGEARMDALERSLAENTASTKQIETNTADIIEFFESVRGAFKVLHWIGRGARPIGWIAAAAAGVWGFWSAIKGGGIGPK